MGPGKLARLLGFRLFHAAAPLLAAPLVLACASFGVTNSLPELPALKGPTNAGDPVSRGEWVFHAAGCALCHGKNGVGGVNNRNSETGGKIPGLTLVKEGYSADELAQRIREGAHDVGKGDKKGPVPPLRMPAYGNWLSKQDVSDLVAYVFSLYPKKAGSKDDWGDDDEASDEPADTGKTKKSAPKGGAKAGKAQPKKGPKDENAAPKNGSKDEKAEPKDDTDEDDPGESGQIENARSGRPSTVAMSVGSETPAENQDHTRASAR